MKSLSENNVRRSAVDQADRRTGAVTICAAICTRDRPEWLRRALDSLLQQSTPPTEIVVVDNAPSNDYTMNLIASDYPKIRYKREYAQGLDFARNKALSETTCDVVAFLDDDVVVSENWIATIQAMFLGDDRIVI